MIKGASLVALAAAISLAACRGGPASGDIAADAATNAPISRDATPAEDQTAPDVGLADAYLEVGASSDADTAANEAGVTDGAAAADGGDAAAGSGPHDDGGALDSAAASAGSVLDRFSVGATVDAGTYSLVKPAFSLTRSCAGSMCITGSF